MNAEYQKQFDMEYMDQARYLQEKYGKPEGAYFVNESCKSGNSKIKRTKEGLYIHHIAEYHPDYPTACSLGGTEEALKVPFEFQGPDWLCYCNMMEHVILHYHIHRLRVQNYQLDGLNDGIVHFLLPEIKLWYITKGRMVKGKWNEPAWNLVKDDESTFQELYNMFYKEFPNEPKYSYGEYKRAQAHKKLQRPKVNE